jgi:hypothetical protein
LSELAFLYDEHVQQRAIREALPAFWTDFHFDNPFIHTWFFFANRSDPFCVSFQKRSRPTCLATGRATEHQRILRTTSIASHKPAALTAQRGVANRSRIGNYYLAALLKMDRQPPLAIPALNRLPFVILSSRWLRISCLQ